MSERTEPGTFDLPATGTDLTGTVRSAVTALPAASVTLTDAVGAQVGRATSDPDGTFRFAGLRPGRYVVVAHHGGYRPRAAAAALPGPGAVELVLEPVAAVRGLVHDPDTGRPVAAATVVAVDPAGEVVARTTSDPDGRYRLEGVDGGGPLTVVVALPGADPVARTVDLRVADGVDQTVDLPVRTLSTLGGVVTAGDRPVPGLVLDLVDAEGRAVAGTVTDSDGRYRFADVPAGRYTVCSGTATPAVRAVGAHAIGADLALA